MSADLFTLKVHHGGMFVNEGVFQYVGGTVTLFEELDPDFMSFYEILNPIRRLGYPPTIVMWYRLPNSELENGLRLIDSDRVVCTMFVEYSAENCNVVDVYVENIDIDIPLPMVPPLDPPDINDLPHGPPYINDPPGAEAVEEGINDSSDLEILVTNGASASTTVKMWNSPTTQNPIQTDGSQLCDNVQVQKFNTRFGGVIFSSQSSSNKYSVTTDNGDSSNPT